AAEPRGAAAAHADATGPWNRRRPQADPLDPDGHVPGRAPPQLRDHGELSADSQQAARDVQGAALTPTAGDPIQGSASASTTTRSSSDTGTTWRFVRGESGAGRENAGEARER